MTKSKLVFPAACAASLLSLVVLQAAPARAEIIELVDKTKMNAKIIHFYDGVYTVETGGNAIKLPKDKVKSITFALPAPRPEFATVEKTFERWRKAMTDGDYEKMIDCYALMFQGFLANQMSQVGEGLKKMQKELEGWKFELKGSTVKGETATLKVLRKKGEESDTGDIAFVKENGEWKMLPPQ
jgi:hypothetical protein